MVLPGSSWLAAGVLPWAAGGSVADALVASFSIIVSSEIGDKLS